MCERLRFLRTQRLTARHEYDLVFSKGEKLWGRSYICYVLLDPSREARLGLVVSRKVGNAVVRNRVKRRLREFFRLNYFRLQPGMQLVIIARASGACQSSVACASELNATLKRFLRHV
ncbi:MAG TPA: ribonuclease P protein component [Candidatus Hydrogenedentes bacterium]|nr:MAG: Ribonuclease P protein component [Candidatus Hydrogenedentes bacterium ADurb.Bin170]HNZ48242.1 ribonuclease P protein component [Candidatus Hydrogenedentota bacterium]HOD95025.1 ribonuclease P protein component [Candidatus Hydrogenedentota bacterium]HOH42378.1 ribonuclease P protein component [Candidatus Hydrogenedentota bacterium]HOM48554.1 ribonuclease P protein component [Candidatus Hydrogenedentota bacterium]